MKSIKNNPILKREIIMEHYQQPRNHQLVVDKRYKQINMHHDTCLDDVFLQVLIENGIIEDIRFDSKACVIATASTSIMSELLKGRHIDEAEAIVQNYFNMVYQKEYDEKLLGEAVVFDTVGRQVNRIICATMGWNGLLKIINESKSKNE